MVTNSPQTQKRSPKHPEPAAATDAAGRAPADLEVASLPQGRVAGAGSTVSPAAMLSLQRSIGNQAALRYITRPATAAATHPQSVSGRPIAVQRVDGEEDEATEQEEEEDDGLGMAQEPEAEEEEEEEEGEEGEESGPTLGINDDGFYAEGLQPFGSDGPTLDLSPKKQSLSFDIPGTELGLPPPDGDWKLGVDAKIPFPPPASMIGLSVGAGLHGGLKLGGVKVAAKHQVTENRATTQHNFQLSGEAEATAAVGGEVSVAIYGGIPYVVTAEAGLKATADANLKLEANVNGSLQAWYTNPAPDSGEKPELVNTAGDVSVSLKGSGELAAALKAYLAGQIFMFKTDFFSFDIASATIAEIAGGGRFGWGWEGKDAKGKFYKKPVLENGKWVDINWLFKEILVAKKMERAQAQLIAKQADVSAMEDLQAFYDLGNQAPVMRQRFNGTIRDLIEQRGKSTQAWDDTNQAVAALEKQVATPPPPGDKAALKAHKALQKQLATLQKTMGKLEKEIAGQNLKITNEQAKFAASLTPENIDKALEKAEQALEKQMASNTKLLQEKVKELKKEMAAKREEIEKQLKDNEKLQTGYAAQLDKASTPASRAYNKNLLDDLKAKGEGLLLQLEQLGAEEERKAAELQKLVTAGE